MQMFLRSLLIFASFASIRSSNPVPDDSEDCLSCQNYVNELDIKWENTTEVAEITKSLERKCQIEKDWGKKQICKKVVDVLVQIPPGIFEGMDTLAWPVALATCATFGKCKVECCAADALPEQIHLSLASTDRSLMGVSWVTLHQEVSKVQYGLAPDSLDMYSSGDTSTYTSAGWVGTIHKAVMENLEPSTTYYYRVGGDEENAANPWSEIFSFTTITPGSSLSFAILADMGYGDMSDDTVTALIELTDSGKLDCVIHSGDISYADGFEPHWDNFFNKVQPIASKIPYMVTPGNHEFWYNFTAYKSRFFMPGVLLEEEYAHGRKLSKTGSGSGDNMYYSWELDNIHFISMNSETAIDTANFNEDEIAWTENDLNSVDRTNTPWLIANFHRPMYCSNDNACSKSGGDKLRAEAEDMFFQHKVDLVLSGHVHSYERTYPVYNNTKLNEGPVYVVQGASGNREGNRGSWPDPLPEWSASHSSEVGYAVMTVTASSLDWTFYDSATREALDHVFFSKD